MKKLIIVLVLMLGFATAGFAEDKQAICNSLKEYAVTVMESRNLGVTESQMMDVIDAQPTNRFTPVVKSIVKMAFAFPDGSSVVDFANLNYGICMAKLDI